MLRSLHVPGRPLLLPNAWDAVSARAVVEAGFPVVATTSAGVANSLGYEDHQGAPREEMLAAAARIAHAVDRPVTVDAEAGYGLGPTELVAELKRVGAAGCNLEDTDHDTQALRDSDEQADWFRQVREAAEAAGYGLVINARVDVFLAAEADVPQSELVPDALARARVYLEAGADCVYPIALWDVEALRAFVEGAGGPVNALAFPKAPPVPALAALGVARVSWGGLLHRATSEHFASILASIPR
jgi:2-methylisocitrate lyase-like PEP mutase family enzyme